MTSNLGYAKPLFILAFDHRASFLKLVGEEAASDAKLVIYEGFKKAVSAGTPPKEHGGILVDEEYGDSIHRDAINEGYISVLTVEKSGQDEFDFEYGEKFGEHIEKYRPTFAKALIRYNPEGDEELNARQRSKLKILSDYCHETGYKFLIEPLILPTEKQLEIVNGDRGQYDNQIRYELMARMIKELQNDGIEPDVWKIEGLESPEQYEAVIKQAKAGGRDNVSAVVLGRGAEKAQVEKWLRAGKGVDGVVGSAIGRTIFHEPLENMKKGNISREEAAGQIAENYQYFYRVFNSND